MIPRLHVPGLVASIVGASCALVAYALQGSLLAAVLWVTAVLVACHGYGVVVERLVGRRVSTGMTIAAGLAALLAGSLPVAACHLLTVHVQVGIVIAGFMLCALERAEPRVARRPPGWVSALVIAGTGALVVTAVLLPRIQISDLMNHGFVIKRLWDTGATGVLHHQLGLQIVGESYFSIGPGVQAASVFEYAVAPGLLVLVLWSELASRDDELALPLFFVAAIPIMLQPELAEQWSGTLWFVAAVFALGPALAERRTAWHAILCAAALAGLRHEYWVFAVPFVAAAVWLPRVERPSRRAVVKAVASWYVVAVALQISLAVGPAHALLHGLLLIAAIALVAIVVVLLGVSWRSPLAVASFATIMYGIALFSGAIRVAQHEPVASFTCWFAGALAVLVTLDAAALRRVVPAIIVALFAAETIILPNFNGLVRGHMVERFERAILAAKVRRAVGEIVDRYQDVRAAQELIPAGARIGFWGKSAAMLDFRRNPIHDLSWPPRVSYADEFLVPLTAKSLAGIDYVIVEDIAATPVVDAWGEYNPPPLGDAAPLLEQGPSAGIARVFRVRR